MPPSLILAAIFIVLIIVGLFISSYREQARQKNYFSSEVTRLRQILIVKEKDLELKNSEVEAAKVETKKAHIFLSEARKLIEQQSSHFPWLADAYADWVNLRFQETEDYFRMKKNPATIAAQKVSELKAVVRETERRFRLTKYRIQFYEKLFPWLLDVSGEDIVTLINQQQAANPPEQEDDDKDDPAKAHLSDLEWSQKSRTERYQIALDRWKSSAKTKWQIGRDFERFVGYQMEISGYDVDYFGAIKGFEDLGRDLIAKNKQETLIIQCKYWAKEKLIHEKHVFQTFATAVEYSIDKRFQMPHEDKLSGAWLEATKVRPMLIVSCALSLRARQAAKALRVRPRTSG